MKITVKKSVVTKTQASKPSAGGTGFPCPTVFPKC
jgi:hypothetical protein